MNVSNYLNSIPLITKSLLVINVAVHAINFIFSVDYSLLVINANLVIYQREYYRIISATFTHGGILHIFFNMSSLLQLGVDLERQFGSIQFLVLSLWTIVLAGLLYVSICWYSSS
jgi:rhomboid protease GluP